MKNEKQLLRFLKQYFSNFVKLSHAFDSMSAYMCACVDVVINEKYQQVNKNYHKSHTH